MKNIYSIFSPELLEEMLKAKYVRAAKHPDFPLTLYSYTETAQYERVWNDCTRNCRGLIVDNAGNVTARPFPKFFNSDEPGAPELDMDAIVEVSDKKDGSLGILYFWDDQPYIATRGSFVSQQARHATDLFRKKFEGEWQHWSRSETKLFEIVYPENRIVLDYGNTDDLFYLGAIDIATGETCDTPEGVERERFADVLKRAPRPNAEGLVVRFVDIDQRVKIKQDDYKALHRIITTCSARSLWEHLAVNAILSENPGLPLIALSKLIKLGEERAKQIVAAGPDWRKSIFGAGGFPENFSRWVNRKCEEIESEVAQRTQEASMEFNTIYYGDGDRKSFALAASKSKHKAALFNMYDKRSPTAIHWMESYPANEIPFAEVG